MQCPCEHHITQRPQMPSSSAHGDESTRITPSRAPSNCGRGKKQSTDLELRRSHGLIPLPSGSSFESHCPPAARISPPHKPPPQHRFSSPLRPQPQLLLFPSHSTQAFTNVPLSATYPSTQLKCSRATRQGSKSARHMAPVPQPRNPPSQFWFKFRDTHNGLPKRVSPE